MSAGRGRRVGWLAPLVALLVLLAGIDAVGAQPPLPGPGPGPGETSTPAADGPTTQRRPAPADPDPSPAVVHPDVSAALEPSMSDPADIVVDDGGSVGVLVELDVTALPGGSIGASTAGAIVQRAEVAQATAQVMAAARDGGSVSDVRSYGVLPVVAMTIDAQALARVAASPSTSAVLPNRLNRPLLDTSANIVDAPQAWDLAATGAGRTIAILDTGVDGTHPRLDAGKVVGGACFSGTGVGLQSLCPNGAHQQEGVAAGRPCTDPPFNLADCWHGTHVAGIAAGNADGTRVGDGIAPDATLLALQVFSWSPSAGSIVASDADILAALQWVYNRRNTYSIAAANLSLGSETTFTGACGGSSMDGIVSLLRGAGIATVAASGNDGLTNAMTHPACVPGVVSVSASDDSDNVWAGSNVSPDLDLYAPGVGIVSAVPGGLGTGTGTSMAAPHVSGAWAVLEEAAGGDGTVDLVEAALESTGVPVFELGVSHPRIDVDDAIVPLGAPFGYLESVRAHPSGIAAVGWAIDRSTTNPISVHVYVDGAFAGSATAGGFRPDIAGAFPGSGANHGLDAPIPAGPGAHWVCAYAINDQVGRSNTTMGCHTVTVPTDPVGTLDSIAQAPNGVRITGWAVDPNSTSAVDVHVYIDGAFAGAYSAAALRPDLAGPFPDHGAEHGLDVTVPDSAVGPRNVCAYAINQGPGSNTVMGCRTIVMQGNPVGALDSVSQGPGGHTVAGWVIDPNSAAPASVHIYVDGAFAGLAAADSPRPDLGAAMPGYGTNHGYTIQFAPTGPGAHTVCAYAINIGPGANSLLGCRTYTSLVDPFGTLDAVATTGSGIIPRGWAYDPNTAGAVDVHVYIDGGFAFIVSADSPRPDLAGAIPGYGTDHGFGPDIAFAGTGPHQVCAYAINVGPGSNVLLGCRMFTR